MDEVLRGYLETLGVENTNSYTYQGLSMQDYEAVFAKLDERDKSRYENTVHQDVKNLIANKREILARYIGQPDKIFEGDDLYTDEQLQYLASQKLMYKIKKIEENTIQILEKNVKIEVDDKFCRIYGQVIVLEDIGVFGGTYE